MFKNLFKKFNAEDGKKQHKTGLPDIARDTAKKNPIVLGMIAIILVIVGVSFLFSKSKSKAVKPIEETYAVQHTSNSESPTANSTSTYHAETEVQASEEHSLTEKQIAFLMEKQKELQLRLAAPLMLVNNNSSSHSSSAIQNAATPSGDANMQFMQQVSSAQTTAQHATTIGPLNSVIAEGSFIHAILESASNSDLPGYLRATVSSPSYSEDGSRILIPVGSRLIGQYKSGMVQGQSRIFVVWTRLITPAGISINLGSSGVDNLGVAGMGADAIDRHFWQRFGMASLLSIIGTGAANVNAANIDKDSFAAQYRSAVANSFSQSATQSFQQNMMIAPTLETFQGKPIMVFVAHDLYFDQAIKQTQPNINVF